MLIAGRPRDLQKILDSLSMSRINFRNIFIFRPHSSTVARFSYEYCMWAGLNIPPGLIWLCQGTKSTHFCLEVLLPSKMYRIFATPIFII